MNKHLQSLSLVATIIFTYVWLQVPLLSGYALQAFALAMLLYFISKRLKKAKLWHVMPEDTSLEMVLISFAFLLLIGATGNLSSYFYPLTYLHLFLLVMTTEVSTSIITTVTVMVFHYALTPTLSSLEVGALLAFPLLLVFFLFAKRQYHEVQVEKELLKAEEQKIATLEKDERALIQFIENFLQPKLKTLKTLLIEGQSNIDTIKTQLSLIENESSKIVDRVEASEAEASAVVQEILQDNQ